MKKIFCMGICTALLCVSFASISYAQQTQEQMHKRLVVLGDSIAAGYGVASEESYAWLLAQANGFELSNFAYDGNDSTFLRWEIVLEQHIREAISDADIIIISIGGNDFLLAEGLDGFKSLIWRSIRGDRSFMPPIWENFAEKFAETIPVIRALNPDAKLIVQTLYNSAPRLPFLRRTFDIAVEGINEGIYTYLEQQPNAFLVADIYSAFDSRSGMIARDMVHPSVDGHVIIAHVLSDIIANTQTPLPHANIRLDDLACVLFPILLLAGFLLLRLPQKLRFPLNLRGSHDTPKQ